MKALHRSHLFPLFVNLLFIVSLLAGCATVKKIWPFSGKGNGQQVIQQEKTEEKLKSEALTYFRRGRFLLAEELFQKIKDRYPFSPYATIAELRQADCKFFEGAYEEAIPLYEEFEKLHPTNPNVPYALFQLGTCYYRLMASPDRDQTFTHKAIETYMRLIRRYPDSPYSFEASRRIRFAINRLAQHEMVVAKWYMRVGELKQARLRLNLILDHYPNTPTAQEASQMLARLGRKGDESVSSSSRGHTVGEERPFWKRLWPF